MIQSSKYKRTLHARISRGTSSDDRFLPRGYVKIFAEMDDLIMTEKLDGQNNCFSKYGLFARSHAIPSELPWDKPLRERWQLIKNDLNDLEIFGENLYAIHSIGYKKPESFFYVFAIRENDRWLSWEEVNFEEKEKAHYVKDFDLMFSSVIVVKYQDGKQVEWKNLQKVWELVRDKPAFTDYVQSEVKAWLES